MKIKTWIAVLLALACLTAALAEDGDLVITWGDEPAGDAEAGAPEPDADAPPAMEAEVASALPEYGQDATLAEGGEGGDGQGTPVVLELVEHKPLQGVRIGIDPGHQAHANTARETVMPGGTETKAKVTGGTSGVASGIPEYETNLQISFKLREALESQGAEVYMTRESHDVDISNQERARMMNDYGVDLMLRIHCDGSEDASRHGISLYCSRSNAIAAESYRAAEAILPRMCEATGAPENGIVSNDNYTGQNWATVPCIMVECGFLSNPDEDWLLNDEDYQWKLATGLTNGIIDYIQLRDGT